MDRFPFLFDGPQPETIYLRQFDVLVFRGLKKRLMILSVIIPCFNEEAVLSQTHLRLTTALDGLHPITCEVNLNCRKP